MIIGLYNLQPKYKNLALEKIRKYYQLKHAVVEDCTPIESNGYDIIYCSSIFDWVSKKYVNPKMITGGTGFDLTMKLPPEIDSIEPHLDFGFTTRGCIRHCKFCVVPQKEGLIKVEGDLLSLWSGKSDKITLFDNNILGLPEHFALVCGQAREHGIEIDFNQGLDHRLLTPEVVDIMKSIRHHEYRFAFDHPSYINTVEKAIDLLQSKGIKRCNWYVLVGYDTTFQQDLARLNYLRERGQNAYVQRYRSKKLGREYIALAEWVNQHHIFQGMTWLQFLKHPDNKKYLYLLGQSK